MFLQIEPGKARGKLDPKMWSSDRYAGEPKLDGSRYLMQVNLGGNRFTSRHISKKTNLFVEKTDNIPHLRDIFVHHNLDADLDGCIFDGEIVWGRDGSFGDGIASKSSIVTEVMGSLPQKAVDLQRENGWVDYYVFDILFDKYWDIRHLPYETRRNILLSHLGDIADPKSHLNIIPSERDNKEALYNEILASGGEGIILKDITSPYGKNWAKVKRKSTYDVIIVGYEDPTKITKKVSGEESVSRYYEKGWIGAIKFGQYYKGKLIEFGSCSGMDEALREQISLNKDKYIGKVIEIEAQERIAKTGRFRHPRFLRFREDKNPEQCIYREGEN